MAPRGIAGVPDRLLLVLLGITILGAALRWLTLGTQSLDGDELFTAWIVPMDVSDLLSTVTRAESTPYPYYLLTAGTTRLLGTGEIGLRAVSALAGTALVPCLFFAARQFVSSRAALVAAALGAVNPFLIWMSQQARAYSLLLLIATLSVAFCGGYLDTGSARARRAWSVTGALAVWTHYYGAFVIAAEAVLILVAARSRREMGAALRACAVPLIAGLVVLPLALHQASIGNPDAINDRTLAVRLLQIPKNFLVGFSSPAELWTAIAAAILVAVALGELVRARNSEDRPGSVWVGAIALLTISMPVALAVAGVDYVQTTSVGPVLIACLIVMGAGFSASRNGMIAAGALCAISIALVVVVATDRRYQRPDWRGALMAVGEARPPRVLLASPGPPPGPLSYYAGPVRELGGSGARVCEVSVIALATIGRFSLRAPRPPELNPRALELPAGFRLVERRRTETFMLLRFRAPTLVHVDGARRASELPEEPGSAYLQGLTNRSHGVPVAGCKATRPGTHR